MGEDGQIRVHKTVRTINADGTETIEESVTIGPSATFGGFEGLEAAQARLQAFKEKNLTEEEKIKAKFEKLSRAAEGTID